jgi:hypothetical protein
VLLRRVLRALATVRTITPVCAAAATAATIAPPAAWFFALGTRCAVAILGTGIRSLLHRRPRLLRRARRALVRAALSLRTLALLWNFRLRPFALGAIGPRRLLLLRALVIWPAAASVALVVRPAAASVALVIRPAATAVTAIATASATACATVAASAVMPVSRLVAWTVATLGALRPRGTHRRFVGSWRLLRWFV